MSLRAGLPRAVAAFALIIAPVACAKVPRGAVLLSEELGGMIEAARRAHLQAVGLYMAQRRALVEQYMERVWIPTFMAKYVPGSGILDSLARAPTAGRKGELMLLFATAGLHQITAVRDTMVKALDEVEGLLRVEIEAHYSDMRLVNQALTAHIRSAAEVTELRDDLRRRIGLDVRELLPLDAINEQLERLAAGGETVAAVATRADSVQNSIRRLLERTR